MTNCSEGKAGTVHPECVGEKHYSDDHGTGSAQKMSKAPDVDLQKDEGGAMPDTTVANALEKARKEMKPYKSTGHKPDSWSSDKGAPNNPTKNASDHKTRDDGSAISDKRKGQREAEKKHKKENKDADKINSGKVSSANANPDYRPPEDEYRVDVWDRLVGIINANNDKPGRPPIDKLGAQKLVARFLQNPDSLSPRMKSLIESGLKANEELNDTPPEAGRFLNENRGQVTRADIEGNKQGTDYSIPVSAISGANPTSRAPESIKDNGELNAEEAASRKKEGVKDQGGSTRPYKVPQEAKSMQGQLYDENQDILTDDKSKIRPDPVVGDPAHNADFEHKKGLLERDAPKKLEITPEDSALMSHRTIDDGRMDFAGMNGPYPEEIPEPRQHPLRPDGTPNPDYQKSANAKPPSFSELMKSKGESSERGMPSGMHPFGHNFNGQAIPIQNGYRQVFISRDEPVMPAPGKMKITKN